MKNKLLLTALLLALPAGLFAAEPAQPPAGHPDKVTALGDESFQRMTPFNLDWSFARAVDAGDQPPAGDADWKTVHIPHDYSIESPFVVPKKKEAKDKELDMGELGLHLGSRSTGYLPGGLAWYKKTFIVPATLAGKMVGILFGGVYMDSDVWINGTHLGHHHYGYTSFSYDLTPHLKIGGENTVLVRVDNKLQSRWYSGSGIYRPVTLVVTDPIHIPVWGTRITTPTVAEDKAVVAMEIQVANDGKTRRDVDLVIRILATDGAEVARTETRQSLAPGDQALVHQDAAVKNPSLWSIETPTLYTAVSQVVVGGKVVDECSTVFGIRTLKFDPNDGFLLNGKYTRLRGVCIHHDNGLLGAESYAWADERRVIKLKEMGCNAIRCAHNPPSEAFLNACDKHGMLVIDEALDEWKRPKAGGYAPFFDDCWQVDLTSMLKRDRNHPCIIMWSIGNEIREQGYPEGAVIARRLADHVRSLDPTRPVTHAIQPGFGSWGGKFPDPAYFDAVDVCGYNYESIKGPGICGTSPTRMW